MNFKKLAIFAFVILLCWNVFLSFKVVEFHGAEEHTIINEVELTGFSTDLTTVIEEVIPSICTVRSENGLSSGFVYLQENGLTYVLTSYHSILNSSSIQVLFDNDLSVNATVVAYDIYSDLALLSMDFAFEVKALEFGDASLLKTGEFALVVGTPISLEYSNTVSLAMISDHNRILDASLASSSKTENYYRNAIQFTSTLNEGNSGGPLLNMDGQLVGMNVMQYDGADAEGIYFATSSNEIQMIADLMLKGEDYTKIHYGIKGNALASMPNYKKTALGISIDLVDGYYVSSVKSNQLAFKAGVLHGDVIVSINGNTIKDEYDVLETQYSNTNEIIFEVERNGERLALVGYTDD